MVRCIQRTLVHHPLEPRACSGRTKPSRLIRQTSNNRIGVSLVQVVVEQQILPDIARAGAFAFPPERRVTGRPRRVSSSN